MTEVQRKPKGDNKLIPEDEDPKQEEVAEDSDAESLDSEGYSKNDPYAAQAKQIDKQARMQEELENSMLHNVSKKVIENKENITFFEKHLKRIIAFAILMFLVAGNASTLFEDMKNSDSSLQAKPSDLFNLNVLIDMKRELIMLFVSVGLYLGARKVNDYLDKCEVEEKEQADKEEEARLLESMKPRKATEEDDVALEAEHEPKKTK